MSGTAVPPPTPSPEPAPSEGDLIRAAQQRTRPDPAGGTTDDGRTREIAGFLEAAGGSLLLSDAELAALRARVQSAPPGTTAKGLAASLVKRGALTSWQARALLKGRRTFHVGNYELLDFLGRGGMGAVFKARQRTLKRTVALKVMAKELVQNEQAVRRFHREIQAAAALDHPNLIHALDAGSVGTTHFLVMEFVEGENLSSLLNRVKRLPIAVACNYALQAAQGLDHIHARGLVHRDIKPSNLIVTRRDSDVPQVKVLDLGLARLLQDRGSTEDERTRTDQILGTPDYIAPEQARRTRDADIRSDVYSLGCTLYRMLTGRLPFEGENAVEKLTARVVDDPPLLRQHCPEAPAELEQVLLRMMARDPGERYQLPADVVQALAPFAEMSPTVLDTVIIKSDALSGLDIAPANADDSNVADPLDEFFQQFESDTTTNLSPGASTMGGELRRRLPEGAGTPKEQAPRPGARTQRAQRDRRAAWIWYAVAGGAAFVALIAAALLFQRGSSATVVIDWPEDARGRATLAIDDEPRTIPPTGPVQLEERAGTRTIRVERDGYEPIVVDLKLTRGETRRVSLTWRRTEESARRQEWERLRKAAEPLAARIAALNADEFIARTETSRAGFQSFRRRFPESAEAGKANALLARLAWPADLLTPSDGMRRDLAAAVNGVPQAQRVKLAAVYGDARLKQWGGIRIIVGSRDGSLIASAGANDPGICLWDAASGALKQRLHVDAGSLLRDVKFNGDGSVLAVSEANGSRIFLFDTNSGRLIRTISASSYVTSYEFSADGGEIIAAVYNDDRVRVWNVQGRDLSRYPKCPGKIGSLAVSPDRKLLAVGDVQGRVHLEDVESGKWVATLAFSESDLAKECGAAIGGVAQSRLRPRTPAGRIVSAMAFSPDGKFLAVRDGSGLDLQVWDLDRKKLALFAVAGGTRTAFQSFEFSRDGRYLLAVSAGSVRLWRLDTLEELPPKSPASQRQASPDQASNAKAAAHAAKKPGFGGSGVVLGARFSPEGQVVSWDDSGQALLTDPQSGKRRLIENPGGGKTTAVAFLPGTATLLTGDEEGNLHVRDLASGKVRVPVEPRITAMALSPNGRRLAISDAAGGLKVIAWPGGDVVLDHKLPLHADVLAFDPAGRRLAVAFFNVAPPVVLDLKLKKSLYRLPGVAIDVDFTPDGKQVLTCHKDGTVQVHDASNGQRMGPLASESLLHSLTPHPDGTSVVLLSAKGRLRQVDLKSRGDRTVVEPSGSQTRSCAVSPDGSLFAVASPALDVRVYDARTGKLKHAFGHKANAVAFSPDGRTIATAGVDGRVRLFYTQFLANRDELLVGSAGGAIRDIRFTPDGRHLLTLNGNGTVYVVRLSEWPLTTRPAAK